MIFCVFGHASLHWGLRNAGTPYDRPRKPNEWVLLNTGFRMYGYASQSWGVPLKDFDMADSGYDPHCHFLWGRRVEVRRVRFHVVLDTDPAVHVHAHLQHLAPSSRQCHHRSRHVWPDCPWKALAD